jgi:hypothetical protein
MTTILDSLAAAQETSGAAEDVPHEPAECRNCGTELTGRYCHACGQQAHLHATLGDLLSEMFEGVAHFDGRLWRTLPLLVFRPGELSRRWKAGERAKFVHPLHVFLFAVFLVFTAPYVTGQASEPLELQRVETRIEAAGGQMVGAAPGQEVDLGELETTASGRFLKKTIAKLDTPEERAYFRTKYMAMAYKLAWVVAPLSMLILALLMAFRPGYTLYDHGVVSLYGLGFFGLLLAIAMLLPRAVAGVWEAVLPIVLPIHAMVHLRGAYGLSWVGASLRSVALGAMTLVAFGLFLAGVFALTAAA